MKRDPAPDVALLPTAVLVVGLNQSMLAELCWHGLVNCPLCRGRHA